MGDKIKRLKAEDRNDSYNSFSAAINSREQLTPKTNAHTYAIELSEIKRKEAGDYDPYDHSDIEHPTTNFETLIHLLKSSFGTGILAMPLAFYHSGYVLGIIGTTLIGMLCTYCMHMLVRTEYELCKRKKVPSLTYPGAAEAALLEGPPFLQKLAPYSGAISNTFLLLYQLGICCVYTVFVAENIKNVLDVYMTTNPLDERIIMLITLLPLIFINYIKNLKFLAPLTTLANVLTLVSFVIIFYFIFNKEVSFEGKEPVGNIRDLPLYFGTVLFALEAIGMIMPLKNEMRNPENFGSKFGVLNIGMLVVLTLYILTGFFGYLAYGSHVGGSISFTIDPDNIAAQICKIMLAVAIFTTHALSMYVAIDIVWTQNLLQRFEKSMYVNIWEYAIRTFLVVITFALAVAIPYIDLFISLVGAFCISIIGIAVPAIMDSCVRYQELRRLKGIFIHGKNIAIVIFSVFGLVVGTGTSIQKIVEKFSPVEVSISSFNSTST
ncbi:proton-coupled amino acid transporter-like protein CG1139 isoform X2 [Anthonomus grandis grandis]|uniref:proton-coupled amino acid transporter-like protein CG1139 isoform X2 n=1 Tax=Anthonomus grandis grandis TaxID=2921223 RepID=UPI0021655F2F|nr:proton-coupled amino acid transporter-like protein CG1139 isoform X2 [Anthonomus grandis grandis]